MTKSEYEPLVDKIRSRLLSWAASSLSFAGQLQLVTSVIAVITSFWCAAFRLPKKCLAEIERLCCAFLWKGNPIAKGGVKVSWEEVCRPKNEGVLGIRRLSDVSLCYSLSLIWRLLSSSKSFWVDWVNNHLIRKGSFWDVTSTTRGSWIWQKLLKLRPLAWDYVRWEIHNGDSIYFWSDPWLPMGRLLNLIREHGTRQIGVRRWAKLSSLVREGEWRLRKTRSPQVNVIIDAISQVTPPSITGGRDVLLWRHENNVYKQRFSSRKTWNQIRGSSQKISWTKLVWFSQGVPRYAFIEWLAFKNKLSTGDRMRMWGIEQLCILCGEKNETRDHLLFACPYSFSVWIEVYGGLSDVPASPDWSATLHRLLSHRYDRLTFILLRLALQTIVYMIWRKRNGRIHQRSPTPIPVLVRLIDRTIRNRISSLHYDTNPRLRLLLHRWFTTRSFDATVYAII